MGRAKQWRIVITDNYGYESFSSIYEIEIYDVDDIQVEDDTILTASSVNGASFNPENVIDNDTTTRWVSDTGDAIGCWVQFEFSTERQINKLRIFGSSASSTFMKNFDFQYYDGSVWQTVYSGTVLNNDTWQTYEWQYPYYISGTVTNNGITIQGATVYLIDEDTEKIRGITTTDSSGNYTFTNLVNVTYHVILDYDDGINHYNAKSKPNITPAEQV